MTKMQSPNYDNTGNEKGARLSQNARAKSTNSAADDASRAPGTDYYYVSLSLLRSQPLLCHKSDIDITPNAPLLITGAARHKAPFSPSQQKKRVEVYNARISLIGVAEK
jgi:hypothetical protein